MASMLFGMFFGAGNLIFPVSMGQMSGSHVWQAAAGFLITGVGLPLLSVAALGISRERGLLELASRAGAGYGLFFTCALYLTIGPLFAIPRCATVSYTVGIEGLLPGQGDPLWLAGFSFLFFAAVLFFSLRPGEIMTWIGKVLNPLFLAFLAVLVLRALSGPMGRTGELPASGAYVDGAFATGLLEGYNTMDALAGLAFGIVVIDVIRRLGVEDPGDVAKSTVKAGAFSAVLMAVIYVLVSVMGAQSAGQLSVSSNGGEALGPDRGSLLRERRRPDPGCDGHRSLPEDGGGADHKLRGDLLPPCPGAVLLPGMGRGLQRVLVPGGEPGPGRHHRLRGAGPYVPLPAGDRAVPPDAGRPLLRGRQAGASVGAGLHGGGGRL